MMKSKMSDTIYDAILRDIVTGVYSPRDFIREAQIAVRYGVSRASVKEDRTSAIPSSHQAKAS